MKILVTGGAGYIGTELVAKLLANPRISEIVIYDNLSRQNFNLFLGPKLDLLKANSDTKVTFVNGELLDTRKLKKCLEGVEMVYHLAAKVVTPFATTDGHISEQTNNWGTAELVYALEDCSTINKVVYTSSTSVYGVADADEDTVPNPQTIYGISKLRGEEHVRRLFDKKQAYIIRCGNVYGYSRSMRFDAVINRFMFEGNFNGRISIHGDGKQRRAFVHINTVADVLAQLVDAEVPSNTYNLVEKNLEVLDVVDAIKQVYPELEFIFVNQHMSLREITVHADLNIRKYVKLPEHRALKDELEEFRTRFSF